MKTMLTILTMLLACSVNCYCSAEMDAKWDAIRSSVMAEQEARSDKFSQVVNREIVQESRSTPAVVTVMEVNPGVWKASNGSTIRDFGPLGYTISRH